MMNKNCCSHSNFASRRDFLRQTALGFGSIALAAFCADQARAEEPLAPKPPHFPAKANRVIFLFMEGGPSQVDLFDYKPALLKHNDTAMPFEMLPREIKAGKAEKPENFGHIFAPVADFAQHGDAGLWMSDYIPHLRQHADKLCVVRSMYCDSPSHGPAVKQMHTGMPNFLRPSMGAWVNYGLGTENENLPGFIAVSAPAGSHNYGSAFLPAVYQGTVLQDAGGAAEASKIRHLNDPDTSTAIQRKQLGFLRKLNTKHLRRVEKDATLEGLIHSFELAFRMQAEAPGVMDYSSETKDTLSLYGVGEEATDEFGRECLIARRLAETGVRFIQVSSKGWDHHNHIKEGLAERCRATDKPVAGLLTDLEQRGMLQDTLVVWTGEFGRTPLVQNDRGRGHNPWGFTLWMAGGGVKPGIAYGHTDELGFGAIQNRIHIHDLHATMLHLLGLDHTRLTYRFGGRDYRLTDVHGRLVKDLLA